MSGTGRLLQGAAPAGGSRRLAAPFD